MKKAEYGYKIQVGNIIEINNGWGPKLNYEVHRVTLKYAYVKWNDTAEGKFPRIFKHYGFQPLPREKYHTTGYTVYIKE
jgi:hypothetical protein